MLLVTILQSLLTTHYLPPTAHYPLLTAHYPLLTSYLPLTTAARSHWHRPQTSHCPLLDGRSAAAVAAAALVGATPLKKRKSAALGDGDRAGDRVGDRDRAGDRAASQTIGGWLREGGERWRRRVSQWGQFRSRDVRPMEPSIEAH